jgi:hypothetical protein
MAFLLKTSISQNIDLGALMKAMHGDFINIHVKHHSHRDLYFKLKISTCFKKLLDCWCERMRVAPEAIMVFYRGRRVGGMDRPETLGMVDGDFLEVRDIAGRPKL